ncbi:MAG: penicillin-binding protein 2 [Coriobacteriia bacterium]|nr:penicillin-binding protein 2 [Coriobacteriia bacterium]
MSSFRQELKPRFAALGIIVLLVLGLLLTRLWSMQVLQGAAYTDQSDENRVREVTVEAPRGRILDRNGKPLVSNRATKAVLVLPSASEDTTLLNRLSITLSVPVSDIKERLASVKESALTPRTIAIDVPMKAVAYIEEHSDEFPGVEVRVQAVRRYPQGALAAHVLGYTGEANDAELNGEGSTLVPGDIVGKAGAEAQFESVLQGDRGRRLLEVDARGTAHRVIEDIAPVAGRDVKLTIDSRVQKVTEAALAQAMDDAHGQSFPKARAGAAVAIDIKTGEVLAMASLPTYDPKAFLGGVPEKTWKRLNDPKSEYPLTNRAIQAQYPAASTFKAMTGLAGLEDGVIRPYTTYSCGGRWTDMGKQWPKWCWNHSGHGYESFYEAVQDSCDVYFYNVGYRFYKMKGEKLQAFARKFGFGSDSGIDLPGEAAGRVPDAKWKSAYNENYPEMQRWLPGDTVNLAIGQGDLLVTPLQVANAYAGIANGGNVMKPHVLKQVLGPDGKPVLKAKPEIAFRTKTSKTNLSTMKTALVMVTESGTARSAFRSFPIAVAGKSGTAQVYGKDDLAWFVAFAPASKPKYCVAVVVEQGGHGGSVAGPATRQILAALLGERVTHVTATDRSR